MSDFHEWWDMLYTDMAADHDQECAADNGTPCKSGDRHEHIAAAYIMPTLKGMIQASGIYKKEAN